MTSGALARHIEGDPEVQQLDQVAPDVVILAMPPDRAQRLKSEVAGLTIEADAELNL